ncbi:MAG: TrkH family potassium uptake protein [Myxococcales bacterium]|nr:TrkH family potassium uptake protein [Myxococcales bacterium]
MRLLIVFGVVGQLLRLFSLAFVLPLLIAAVELDWTIAGHFAIALTSTLAFGFLFSTGFRPPKVFYRAEALSVVALTWLFISMFGAIPYVFAGLSFVDGLFEAMSGFTTTGATVLTDFSKYGKAFYLWRSMTQWFGGLGVIALFVIVLPRLGIAGRQMLFAEASTAPGEAVSPQVRSASSKLWLLYSGMTAVLITLLIIAGMTLYEAVCHAFTTMAAGGFSPHPESVGGYKNPAVEWILIVFMLLAGTSFPLIWTVLTRRPLEFFRDGEFLLYSGVCIGGGLLVSVVWSGGIPTLEQVRHGLFQASSLISSTGYASTDYNLWNDGARVILVFIMVVGGCAGSAAGGPKSVRHLLVTKHIYREITKTLHPKAVIAIKYKGQPVRDDVMNAVFNTVALYIGSYFVIGVIMSALTRDMILGFSAALACVGNIGPGFGAAGPMGNFAGFSDFGKIVLTFGMWIGRLEIVTVLALLHPDVLRSVRLSSFRR